MSEEDLKTEIIKTDNGSKITKSIFSQTVKTIYETRGRKVDELKSATKKALVKQDKLK